MRSTRRLWGWLTMAAALLVGAAGCDHAGEPTGPDRTVAIEAAKPIRPPKSPVKIRQVNVDGAFTIGGAPTSVQIDIQNPNGEVTNVVVRVSFVQMNLPTSPVEHPASCPNADGVLPPGTCTMSIDAAAESGQLVPGAARLLIELYQGLAGALTLLDSKSLEVTLAAGSPTITVLDLSSTELTIGGPGTPYTISIHNPGAPLPEVFIQAEIHQNGNGFGAGGTNVFCPNLDAVLPTGTCTMQRFASPTNPSGGIITMQPGPANLVVTVYQGFTTSVVLDSRTIEVTLVEAEPPSITAVTLASNTLAIGGARVGYTASLTNPTGASLSSIVLQSVIRQNGNEWGAGGVVVDCQAGTGVLPPGNCTVSFTVGASNITGGPNPLVPGAADLVFILYQTSPALTALDTFTVPVTLVSSD